MEIQLDVVYDENCKFERGKKDDHGKGQSTFWICWNIVNNWIIWFKLLNIFWKMLTISTNNYLNLCIDKKLILK